MGYFGEQRARPEQWNPEHAGDRRRRSDRDEAPRLPFEQQQLECQQHRGDRRREDGRHAAGSARHEQRLPLDRRQVKRLPEQGAERATGDDDRSLGAVGPPGADRQRRRQGLQDRDLGIHPAPADEDRLEGFGDAVAADLLGAVPRHQSDDQAADHGNERPPRTERARGRGDERRREPMEVGEVREEADEADQGPGDTGAHHADERGHAAQGDESRIRCEVAESVFGGDVSSHDVSECNRDRAAMDAGSFRATASRFGPGCRITKRYLVHASRV